VTSGLEDRNPYVRRTAVMGVLKLYNIDPEVVRNTGMNRPDTLRAESRPEHDAKLRLGGIVLKGPQFESGWGKRWGFLRKRTFLNSRLGCILSA